MLTRDEWVALFDGLAGLPYGGEVVDQRTHALQCAAHAAADGADDEIVAAAALHDVGRARDVARKYRGPHEQAGAAFAREHLTERAAWAIEQHVAAKRYLVTMDPAYHDTLSPTSVRSLEVQGGPMTMAEAALFETHPWADDAVALRRWDDAAKDPDGPVLDVEEVLRRIEGASRRD